MKTSDGRDYRLKRPNPLVAKQNNWGSDVTYHNFDFIAEESREVHRKPPVAAPSAPPSTVVESVPQKRQPLPPIEDVLQQNPVVPEAKPEEPKPKPEPARLPREDEVVCWCLPARYEEKVDEFYGTKHKALVYGKQFLFPCIIAAMNDLSLQFWTTDPERKIGERSVIYPKEFANGKPLKQYRWWQIVRIQEHQNGFLITASPSTYSPSFDPRKS